MDLSMFEDCLDRYGADLAIWPPASRAAGAALLESSAAARAAHRDLREIEDVIRAARPEPADGGAIAARATRHRQARPAIRPTAWAAATLAALVLGLFVGGLFVDGRGPDHEDSPDHVMTTAFDPGGAADVD